MKFSWADEKSPKLGSDETRNHVSFPEVVSAIQDGRLLDVVEHSTRLRQEVAVVEIGGYAYGVPFVREADGTWFLKTVFPSRKLTRLYLRGGGHHENRAVH